MDPPDACPGRRSRHLKDRRRRRPTGQTPLPSSGRADDWSLRGATRMRGSNAAGPSAALRPPCPSTTRPSPSKLQVDSAHTQRLRSSAPERVADLQPHCTQSVTLLANPASPPTVLGFCQRHTSANNSGCAELPRPSRGAKWPGEARGASSWRRRLADASPCRSRPCSSKCRRQCRADAPRCSARRGLAPRGLAPNPLLQRSGFGAGSTSHERSLCDTRSRACMLEGTLPRHAVAPPSSPAGIPARPPAHVQAQLRRHRRSHRRQMLPRCMRWQQGHPATGVRTRPEDLIRMLASQGKDPQRPHACHLGSQSAPTHREQNSLRSPHFGV
mmetsp:Transcript_104165/g.334152  ORF Transcript_104165/g.334152 Transcript_104165/m.334152 type:complete len:329 (+) Transcript_104165:1333-2319(+)